MKPQTARALAYLRLRGADGVTAAEAWRALGQERFPARVWELIRLHGYRIDRVMERSDDGKRFARWYFVAAPVRFRAIAGTQEGMAL